MLNTASQLFINLHETHMWITFTIKIVLKILCDRASLLTVDLHSFEKLNTLENSSFITQLIV